MIELSSHFRDNHRNRHTEWLRQRQWFIKARQDQQRRDEIDEQAEDNLISLALEAAIATEMEIRAFRARMDTYESRLDDYDKKLDLFDEAVARALIEQIERLDQLEAEKQAMLDKAFVLEDGRRVFRSEDGSYAIDERGERLEREAVETFGIPEGRYNAESYREKLDDIDLTTSELEKLHRAQAEIDAAREQGAEVRELIEKGRDLSGEDEVTMEALEELDAELADTMPGKLPTIPASAMKFVSGLDPSAAPPVRNSFAEAAEIRPDSSATVAPQTPTGLEISG